MDRIRKKKKGQSAVEYIVLATTVTIVVLVGFDEHLGMLIQARNLAERVFNENLRGILGTNAVLASRTSSVVGDYP